MQPRAEYVPGSGWRLATRYRHTAILPSTYLDYLLLEASARSDQVLTALLGNQSHGPDTPRRWNGKTVQPFDTGTQRGLIMGLIVLVILSLSRLRQLISSLSHPERG